MSLRGIAERLGISFSTARKYTFGIPNPSRPGRHVTHGLTGDPIFQYWRNMIARCMNPDHPNYKHYGVRGITVYAEWQTDPRPFVSWVLDTLGPRPDGITPGGRARWSLDRIDNDGNYEPGNLRWLDIVAQQQNRRSTKMTPETVLKLRELAATGRYTQRALAEMFGLTPNGVGQIAGYRTWKNVGGPLPTWPRNVARTNAGMAA
jgi:hypothetical protein